jgi:hypothetical protein
MQIAIPSRGRAHLHRTFFNLPPKWQRQTSIVVPRNEVDSYVASGVPPLRVWGIDISGISHVRQTIVDHAVDKVLMLDDDLDFFVRRTDDRTKLLKATPVDIDNMLKACDVALNKYTHIGIATREGANRNVTPIIESVRLLRALGYRADTLRQLQIRFDRVPVMEDFDVALQLLRLGHPSACINSWAQDQPGSNTEGGCSLYRTSKVQAEGARKLKKLHPEFVTVVEKKPLKSGGWDGQPRTDVRIAWKKALGQ